MTHVNSIRIAFLLGILLCSGCIIEINTKVQLKENSQPPTFTLKGNGVRATFWVYGPYESKAEMERDLLYVGRKSPLWAIKPTLVNVDVPVWRFSPITYGSKPDGYVQFFPKTGEIPTLIEGKYYYFWVSVNSASNGGTGFSIKDGKAVRLP
jgi:hypothetical protein